MRTATNLSGIRELVSQCGLTAIHRRRRKTDGVKEGAHTVCKIKNLPSTQCTQHIMHTCVQVTRVHVMHS